MVVNLSKKAVSNEDEVDSAADRSERCREQDDGSGEEGKSEGSLSPGSVRQR